MVYHDESKYVNPPTSVAVPFGVTTTISIAPTEWAGDKAVIAVDETTTILVAATPPTVTLVAPVKFVPKIVKAVKPVVCPELGFTKEMLGVGAGHGP